MRRFRDLAAAQGPPPAGWLVGVLVRLPGEPEPVRHFWAVALEDRAKAEWAAADRAIQIGDIASSPHRGTEPVEAMRKLGPHAFEWSGLVMGEVRALGVKSPRRWLAG
jgi:hypothetical protein